MSRLLPLALALLVGTQLCGCAAFQRRHEAKRAKPVALPAPLLVGTITLVNEEGRFVLIDSGMNPSPFAGAVLKSRRADAESGELKAGAIRKRPFAIADVVKGTPQVGDQVFQQPQ